MDLFLLLLTFLALACAYKPLFNKCCRRDQAYLQANRTCETDSFRHPQPSSGDWLPPIFTIDDSGARFVHLSPDEYDARDDWIPRCGPGFDLGERVFEGGNTAVFAISLDESGAPAARLLDDPELPEVDVTDGLCLDRVIDDGVDGNAASLYVAKMCLRSPCEHRICVRKCCPQFYSFTQQHFREKRDVCTESSVPWTPTGIYRINRWSADRLDVPPEQVNVLYGGVPCAQYIALDPNDDAEDVFYLTERGGLFVPRMQLELDQYCVEDVSGYGVVSYVCPPSDGANRSPWHSAGNSRAPFVAAAIASQVCLLATALVYGAVPQLRNLQGRIVINLVCALFCAFMFITLIQFRGGGVNRGLCKAVGALGHYFLMAAFFWLSVMSFDLWRTLGRMKLTPGHNTGYKSSRTLLFYAFYAWGSPLVISTVTLVMDFAPGISPFYPKPYFAYNACWFVSPDRMLLYFTGPMAILWVANLVFFAMTLASLLKLRKEAKVLKDQSESRTHRKHKSRFVLYLKLVVVMGAGWVLELVSWVTGGSVYLWSVIDMLNLLQGVFIFLIFVCKRKVFKLLRTRLRLCLKASSNNNQQQRRPQINSVLTTDL